MDFLPIEFSSQDRDWVHECIEGWKMALNIASHGGTPRRNLEGSWPDPESPKVALLFADALLDLSIDESLILENDACRSVLEQAASQAATLLFQWTSSLEPDQSPEGQLLVHALAGDRAAKLYTRFRPFAFRHVSGRLLQLLLGNRVPSAIAIGVDLLVTQPPADWKDASLAISALMQSSHWKVADVFPRILDATQPAVLAPAIDVANLLVRSKGVSPHPAAERFDVLLQLFGQVVQQLAALEEDPSRYSDRVADIQRILFDGVSLTVSICHFFALQKDPRAVGKLTQALDLGHRRIKTEAAYALAAIGEPRAVDLLVELMQDHASRPRVLAYLRELGLEDRIPVEWTSSLSDAQSQLAVWLSQPEQFAIPPTEIDCIDQRTLTWPGCDGMQECFLLRFQYQIGEAAHTNIGFAGPCAYAFPFDVSSLGHDELYGMFLAQDIEDPTARRSAWGTEDLEELAEDEALLELIAECGFSDLKPSHQVQFLGNRAVVAHAVDPQGNPVRVLGDEEGCITDSASYPLAHDRLIARWMGRCASNAIGW